MSFLALSVFRRNKLPWVSLTLGSIGLPQDICSGLTDQITSQIWLKHLNVTSLQEDVNDVSTG